MTSIAFAAVICEADDPCSVTAAYEPESSFTMFGVQPFLCTFDIEAPAPNS